jgi:hypothetical protein
MNDKVLRKFSQESFAAASLADTSLDNGVAYLAAVRFPAG